MSRNQSPDKLKEGAEWGGTAGRRRGGFTRTNMLLLRPGGGGTEPRPPLKAERSQRRLAPLQNVTAELVTDPLASTCDLNFNAFTCTNRTVLSNTLCFHFHPSVYKVVQECSRFSASCDNMYFAGTLQEPRPNTEVQMT